MPKVFPYTPYIFSSPRSSLPFPSSFKGKVPAAVLRYSFIYYSGIFFSASMIGVASYKGKCLEKLKSLENSQLAKYIERLSSG